MPETWRYWCNGKFCPLSVLVLFLFGLIVHFRMSVVLASVRRCKEICANVEEVKETIKSYRLVIEASCNFHSKL